MWSDPVQIIVDVFRESLVIAVKLSLPVLLTGLVVGLIISILQVATQLQEQTLTFVPKIIAVGIVLFILAPWLTREIVEYTEYIFASLHKILW